MNVPDKATEIRAAITAVFAFLTALWGMTGWAVVILLICIALDYITGTWAACSKGQWSSSSARQGLWHKLGEICALLVAGLCDIAMKVILESTIADALAGITLPHAAFTLLVSVWYIFTELGSIIENAAELGAPVPSWLTKAIAQIRNKTDPTGPEMPPVSSPETSNLSPENKPSDDVK